MFEPFKFTPAVQPDPEKPVEFTLKPIDNPTLFRLTKAYGRPDGLDYEDLVHVLERHVVGWEGLSDPYSPHAKRDLLKGEGNMGLLMLLGQCANELYNRQALKEADRKNS